MKSLQGFKSAFLAKSAEPYTALDKIDSTLAALVTPDVLGIPVNSIVNQNIDNDGAGNIAIMPDMLRDSFQIGVTHPAFIRRNPASPYQLQYSNDGGTTWLDVGSATGAGDMLKSTYDPANLGYVDRAAALKDGAGALNADGIRALIPDQRVQEITAFFALVRGFLTTSASGFLRLPGGIIDAFLTGDANIATGVNYVISPSGTLTQTDNGTEMSVDLVPVYVSGTPTKGTLMLLYSGDISKFGLAYQDSDWQYVNGAGDGLIRTYSDGSESLSILHRTFDLVGTVATTISPRLYVYEGAGAFSILGVQLILS